MLKSWGWDGWVAHEILETAHSPNSSFPFLFDFGLGLGLVKDQHKIEILLT